MAISINNGLESVGIIANIVCGFQTMEQKEAWGVQVGRWQGFKELGIWDWEFVLTI